MGSFLSSTLNALPPLRNFILPTPEAYVTLLSIWQYFPLVTIAQWLTSWHPAGKTSSKDSIFNIPGRIAWCAMEIVGPINLIYILTTLPTKVSNLNIQTLPLPNKLIASLYVIHYVNRAIISPFFAAPSMSPIHVFIAASAALFNWMNSTCLACWLVGYNVTTIPGYYPSSGSSLGQASMMTPEKVLEESLESTAGTSLMIPAVGLALFFVGMAGNIYAERTLFALRREAADKQAQQTSTDDAKDAPKEKQSNKYHKVYTIPPKSGLFASILYPHYVFEWLEWTGFALVGTTVFPALSPPSLIPDVLSTAFTSTTGGMPGMGMGGASSGAGLGFRPTLHLAPWLLPAVWAAGKLRVPVLPLPAMVFVVNAVTNMLPHARWGRKWYVEKFGEGEEGVGGRGAVVPFVSWL
ncbi:hypothetical protein BDW74DRAFT_150542 [Aspergillus multicolor]|uniref:3-oxo-5-alpha-steroid 4-dehydrogenase family protein n=1 Tax=Aspergillus multicolor TaxID=41759 RepID=UPI003CCE234E